MSLGLIETRIISPEEEIFSGDVEMIVLPGEEGDFSAMFEHAPLITYLRPGKIEIFSNDKKSYFVSGGFVKVNENKCTVMVEYIKNIGQIDIKLNNDKISELLTRIDNESDDASKKQLLSEIEILREENEFFSND